MSTKELKLYGTTISIIVALLLLIATGNLDYGYYQFLRIIVTVAAGLSCYSAYKFKGYFVSVVGGLVAILFNPFAPVYLQKSTWQVMDVLTAVFFGVFALVLLTTKNLDEFHRKEK